MTRFTTFQPIFPLPLLSIPFIHEPRCLWYHWCVGCGWKIHILIISKCCTELPTEEPTIWMYTWVCDKRHRVLFAKFMNYVVEVATIAYNVQNRRAREFIRILLGYYLAFVAWPVNELNISGGWRLKAERCAIDEQQDCWWIYLVKCFGELIGDSKCFGVSENLWTTIFIWDYS